MLRLRLQQGEQAHVYREKENRDEEQTEGVDEESSFHHDDITTAKTNALQHRSRGASVSTITTSSSPALSLNVNPRTGFPEDPDGLVDLSMFEF